MAFDKGFFINASLILLNVFLGCWIISSWNSVINFSAALFLFYIEMQRQKNNRRFLNRHDRLTEAHNRLVVAIRAGDDIQPIIEEMDLEFGLHFGLHFGILHESVNWKRDGF